MQLARYHFIIGVILAILISSCAQVGTISGGDEDEFAPVPVQSKTDPPNKTVNFSGNEVSITFNEYFKLNNSSENIVMIPPHATIKTRVKKKTLTLYWEDTLKPNTTYSIYLNNAVADITEGNDSIVQYVFSTGPELDSLEYVTFVGDSKTGAERSNISVVLYSESGNDLISVGKTDASGKVNLRNLHPGTYTLIAINDENKDLQVDPDEEIGFHEEEYVSLNESLIDSSVIRLFPPLEKAGIGTVKFIEPSSIILTATRPLPGSEIKVNDKPIQSDQMRFLSEDSVIIFLQDSIDAGLTVSVNSELLSDTVKVKLRSSRDNTIRYNNIKKHDLAPSDTLYVELNDLITNVDTSKIHIYRKSDSSSVSYRTEHSLNRCYFHITKEVTEEVFFTIQDGAFQCVHGSSPDFSPIFNLLPDRKFGVIILDLTAYEESIVVSSIRDGKIERITKVRDPKEPLTLKELPPGDYTFTIIRDSNTNGKWDTGELETRLQPELIDLYTEPSKLRANWEVTVPLNPQK